MRVIICGVGQVGYGIAERLTREGHEITVIDILQSTIDRVCNKLDVRGITGHGAHPEILAKAGAEDADMIVAVTYSDEINMIACQVARNLFDTPLKIARIRSQAYLENQYSPLFSNGDSYIDVVISPEAELAQTIFRRLTLQDASDVWSFANNHITALGLECLDNCPVLRAPLRKLTDLFPDLETTVVAIKRDGIVQIASGDTELLAGDIAYLVTKPQKVSRVFKLFGHAEKQVGRILIAGGGNVGLYVAQMLEGADIRRKIAIIEHDRDRAQSISGLLSKTKILHGSTLDVAVLEEAGVEDSDLYIGLTDSDQTNVLGSILAKQCGSKGNMALVNNNIYQEFSRTLGVDVFLNPRSITISRILQHMRRGRILSVYEIANSKAEMLEGEVMSSSSLLGKPLSELDLSSSIRIGAIYRAGEVIQPRSDTMIRVGDRVVVFALSSSVKEVEYLFRTSFDYMFN